MPEPPDVSHLADITKQFRTADAKGDTFGLTHDQAKYAKATFDCLSDDYFSLVQSQLPSLFGVTPRQAEKMGADYEVVKLPITRVFRSPDSLRKTPSVRISWLARKLLDLADAMLWDLQVTRAELTILRR